MDNIPITWDHNNIAYPQLNVENVTIKNAILNKKNSFFNLNYGIYKARFNNFIVNNYYSIYGAITNDYSITFDHTKCNYFSFLIKKYFFKFLEIFLKNYIQILIIHIVSILKKGNKYNIALNLLYKIAILLITIHKSINLIISKNNKISESNLLWQYQLVLKTLKLYELTYIMETVNC